MDPGFSFGCRRGTLPCGALGRQVCWEACPSLGADVTQKLQGKYLGSCFEHSPQAPLMQVRLEASPLGSHGGKGCRSVPGACPAGVHTLRFRGGTCPGTHRMQRGPPGCVPFQSRSESWSVAGQGPQASPTAAHRGPSATGRHRGPPCLSQGPTPALPATSTLFTTPFPDCAGRVIASKCPRLTGMLKYILISRPPSWADRGR